MLLIPTTYKDTETETIPQLDKVKFKAWLKSRKIKRREELKLLLKGFQGPSAPANAPPVFEAFAFDLKNLCRHSFSQGKLEGGRNLKLSLKVFQGPAGV